MPEVPAPKGVWKRFLKPKFSDNPEEWKTKMLELAEDYIISNNLDENEIRKNNTFFSGIIHHIYCNLFKPFYFNYGDCKLLEYIWDTYISLCNIYNKYPTMLEFSLLTNISLNTFNVWKNSSTRVYIYYIKENDYIIDNISWFINQFPDVEYYKVPSTGHCDLYKKMVQNCENTLRRGAGEGNKIGSIFLLKSLYGYTEIAPIQIETAKNTALTAADLPQLGNNSSLLSDNSDKQD